MATFEARSPVDGPASWSSVRSSPRVWGLSARELLDAWWRSQGVAWIERGQGGSVGSGADLFLLTEPGQLVTFELQRFVASLSWNRPSISRIRIDTADDEDFRERLVYGDGGVVIGVRREYSSQVRGSRRVLLTSSASIATRWATSKDRRVTWRSLREDGTLSRSDHHRVTGDYFQAGEHSQEGLLITSLIERWRDPDRVIPSLREVAPAVWSEAGQSLGEDDIAVGPAWIGRSTAPGKCVVGPAWLPDDPGRDREPAAMLAIIDVPARTRRNDVSMSHATLADSVKRCIDLMVSLGVLLVFSPLLLLLGLAVLVDDGWPIFFGHERQTRGGEIFRCLKLRTMRRNAEGMAEQLRSINVCDGPQVFIANDPRVTRVGRWLRRFHLDELPQFLNVLRGEMSLVGPRPSPERENRMCPAWRDARLSVRPGITGLWQVCRTRKPGLDFQEWIRFDIHYVSHRSFRLDAWIVWRTIRGLFLKESSDAPHPPGKA